MAQSNVDAPVTIMASKLDKLMDRLEAAENDAINVFAEINALRKGVTDALGIDWDKVCPDDKAIIAECARVRRSNDMTQTYLTQLEQGVCQALGLDHGEDDFTPITLIIAKVREMREELSLTRAGLRVNILRLSPNTSHDEIDAMLRQFKPTRATDPLAAYSDPTCPERNCDRCNQPYRGPAVYCSLACALADA